MTRQELWEKHRLRARVYRQGYIPFEADGLFHVVVSCPSACVSAASSWVRREYLQVALAETAARTLQLRQAKRSTPRYDQVSV